MGATAKPAIGVIGLGAMGAPIARHLARADREVRLFDRDIERARELAAELAVPVGESAQDVARHCEVALVVVDTDAAVRDVVAGLLAERGALRWVLVCSSVSPATIRWCAQQASGGGVAVLDAAMVGGVRGAESGEMTLLVGGDADALASARWAVEPWTATVHHLGPLGAGQIAKSANNLIHWAQVCAIEEAFRLVERAGVSVPAVRRALCDGPADSRALRELEQMRLTWWRKDLDGLRTLADALPAPHTVADMCAELMPAITVDSLAQLLSPD